MKKIVKFNGVDIELNFKNGFAMVEKGEKYNFVNHNGELLSPNQWFDFAEDFRNDGFAYVRFGKNKNLINKKGELMFNGISIKNIQMYCDDRYHIVSSELGITYVKPNGEFAFGSDMWFENGVRFCKKDKYVQVRKNGKWNFIDVNGNFLFKDFIFDYVEGFFRGFAMVRLYGKENYVNEDGELLCKNAWFEKVNEYFVGEYTRVELYGNDYLIDRKGNLYVGNKFHEETIKRVQWPKEPIWPKELV